MPENPKDRLQRLKSLRARIQQQKNTVEALKRDGHVYEDAERQLTQMRDELRASEGRSPARSRPRNTSASQSRN
jgi:hypothetical protein